VTPRKTRRKSADDYVTVVMRLTAEVHEDLRAIARLAAVPTEIVGAVLLAREVHLRTRKKLL
jgi:hypothetical protein